MGSEVTLSLYNDASAAYQILKQAYQHSKYPIGSKWAIKHIEECVAQDSLVGLWLGEELIGFISLLKIDASTVEILMLVISPKYWGQGLMKSALLQLLHSYNEVWLEVHEENRPAKQLYLKLGFEITGKRPKYYQNDGAALVMRYKKS